MLIRAISISSTLQEARRLAALLPDGVQARPLSSRESIWEVLRAEPVDLVAVEDSALEGSAAAFITEIRAQPEAPEVIVFVRDSDPDRRAELQAAHAFAVVERDAAKAEVAHALAGLVNRLVEQGHRGMLVELTNSERSLSDFATSSPAMRTFLAFVRKVVDSDSTLLVLGETGTGKEYLSRAIHAESPRSGCPFVPVNCSALSETLLESELFGHVEGAFTGALRGRKGYFEMAHGGTLFLDEVGEMRPQTQVKLLRVLQDRKVQPVGSEHEVEVDVRLIAATNRDLAAEVEAGRFRSDLFYRLSVVPLVVPPLRDRREDIPGLFESHVEHFSIAMNRGITGVRGDAMALLVDHDWPGNVREIINVAERAVLLCEGDEITPRDLPAEVRGIGQPILVLDAAVSTAGAAILESSETLAARPFKQARRAVLEAFERRYLDLLLTRNGGRINDAAAQSGLHTRSLYEKMRQLGLRKESYKRRPG